MAKNILFIIDHLGVGGVQDFLLTFCKKRSHLDAITIVSIFANDHYSERLKKAGATVIFLSPTPYSYAAVINPASFLRFRSYYRQANATFDDIHLKLFASFTYASIMKLWRDPRVSAGLDANRKQHPFPIQVLFWAFARHYRRFYLNTLLRNDFAAFGLRADRLRDQRYPVAHRLSDTPQRYPKPHAFLSVGRGIPQKGHAEAVRLFELINDRLRGEACLTVLGEGPAIEVLKRAQETHQPNGSVSFPGAVANYDDWLTGASAIIRMAVGEDTNSVIREGILAGKVVATTMEGPGCLELARRGLVVVIDRGDLAGSADRCVAAVLSMTPAKSLMLTAGAEELWPDAEAFLAYG